jgi:hypothetical protein
VLFLQFKSYENEFDKGIQFVQFCCIEKDSSIYGCMSDFDGFSNLYINTKENNIDSIYLYIKYPIEGDLNIVYSKPIKILLRRIGLFEAIYIDKEFQIILTKYSILSKKELRKYKRSIISARKKLRQQKQIKTRNYCI